MRTCRMDGQPVKKSHFAPLWGVKWALVAIALISVTGMAFAGGCQNSSDPTRPKCTGSNEEWRESVGDGFEKAMLKCPSVSRSPQANTLRADLKVVKVFGPEWNSTLDRADDLKKVCAVAAPPKR